MLHSKLFNRISKREKYSRRRIFDDDADINFINERNMKFNKKLERFYGDYTEEIKQNLERGTAVWAQEVVDRIAGENHDVLRSFSAADNSCVCQEWLLLPVCIALLDITDGKSFNRLNGLFCAEYHCSCVFIIITKIWILYAWRYCIDFTRNTG